MWIFFFLFVFKTFVGFSAHIEYLISVSGNQYEFNIFDKFMGEIQVFWNTKEMEKFIQNEMKILNIQKIKEENKPFLIILSSCKSY